MTGAKILIQTLIDLGVTDIFGYPGGQVIDIYDELYQASGSLRHILTAHEQGAAHAADAYARVTGKTGVVLATSGPGATNLVTGIATAMLDSIPMVAITGNVPTAQIGKDSFQEINITGVTMPITKHNYFVTDVSTLADIVREAFMLAHSGRPGPVLIDIPRDVQRAQCAYVPAGPLPVSGGEKAAQCDIERAAELIAAAERPYIYIGGGTAGRDMTDSILRFAQKADACVGCSLMGLSVLPHDHERFLGMEGMHGKYASTHACRDADLIIGIGVRFSDRATGDTRQFEQGTKIIHIDADLAEINKNVTCEVGIVGDIQDAVERLCALIEVQHHEAWQAHIRALKAAQQSRECAVPAGSLKPQTIFEIINAGKSADTVIATDVGQHQMWTAQYIALDKPRRFVTSGGLGTMGYGLGAAIGAGIGTGEKTVLITGDGSFGMNLNELATAVTYRVPVVIVLFNNGVLGMVRQWQTLLKDKRYASTTLDRKTDFVMLAEAFGAAAGRARTAAEFEALFKQAMAGNEPFLIEVMMDKDEKVITMEAPDGAADI